MASPGIRIINLPWTFTRQDLSRFVKRTLDTRVKFSKVLYDKSTGLSRGIGIIQLDNERLSKDVIRRGTLDVEGRTCIVLRMDRQESRPNTQPTPSE